jgi:hypothetical protein
MYRFIIFNKHDEKMLFFSFLLGCFLEKMFPGFAHPFSALISGPSQCGKTVFLSKILKAPHLYISEPLTRVVWCYGAKNVSQMAKLHNISYLPINFVEGIPDLEELDSDGEKLCVVLDDLMTSAGKSRDVSDLFTKGCHHRDLSVFLTMQNFFHQGHSMRDIHTSCLYNVVMKNPCDMSQIRYVERQMFPDKKNYLVDAYKLATKKPYGYLGIDLRQDTSDDERLFTNIFPGEGVFSYFKHVK